MKYLLSVIAFVVCCLSLAAQETSITFRISGIEEGHKVGLLLIDGNYNKDIDAIIKNGEASLDLDIPNGRGFYLTVDGKNVYEVVVISKGEKEIVTGTFEDGRVKDLNITGSPTYEHYLKDKVDRESLNKLHNEIYSSQVVQEYSDAYKAHDTLKIKEIKATDAYKKFEQADHDFFKEVERQYKECEEKNKDNWFGPFFMLTNYAYLTSQNEAEYNMFTEEAKNSFYGKIVHDKIFPPSRIGEQLPDFKFKNHSDGKEMSFYEICKQNKYVLIDFWASWCGPCRREIPNFKSQYELYKDKGFQIISISADSKEADWLKALNTEKLEWPNDIDGDKGICKLYAVSAYPTVYLVDHDAKIIARDMNCRGDKLKTLLQELFK